MRLRFAPSPTGWLHLGNARAALFNWLLARQAHGAFVLRIEDTDRERSRPEFGEDLLSSLRWLGLNWDEGPDLGGAYGPYVQSERFGRYRSVADALVASGKAFPCYCSEAQLEADREVAIATQQPHVYSGRCRNLSLEARAAQNAEGIPPVVRFQMPTRPFRFADLIKGELEFDGALLGDFVILKSDGSATYNFAVVVDDWQMGISHVLRGEDHISNTPRQIALYEALGAPVPQFGHLPIILGPDHAKLSKRHGATSVRQFREEGYLPEALLNYLALLGWSPTGNQEVFSADELIAQFGIERIQKSGAIFDLAKLRWLNEQHLRRMSPLEIATRGAAWLDGWLPADLDGRREALVGLVVDALTTLADLPEKLSFCREGAPALSEEVREKALGTAEAAIVLDAAIAHAQSAANAWEPAALHAWLQALPAGLGLKAKQVMWPIRAAVTGATGGPELFRLLALLGRERVLARLEATRAQL